MEYSLLRAGCVSPSLKVADCLYNKGKIIDAIKAAQTEKLNLLVFPELCITGYTCQDLFLQKALTQNALKSLLDIVENTKNTDVLCAIGLPFQYKDALYNVAAWIHKGNILALVPKSFIPNYSEFYERRWFTPYLSDEIQQIDINNCKIPFGTNIILSDMGCKDVRIAAEICEDVWVPQSPSTSHALNGATVIINLSASNEVVGKADYRRTLVSSQSAKTLSAYIYANAGHDESTQDMIFSGHSIIALNGSIKAQSTLFSDCDKIIYADLDMERITQDRIKSTTFAECSKINRKNYYTIDIELGNNVFDIDKNAELKTFIDPHPFVPSGLQERSNRCLAVVEMQAEGLAKRLRHINCQSAVIGLSGGLDSTLALLITESAFDKCGLDRSKITSITMPAFGTTSRTYNNACILAKKTGSTLIEINIKDAVNIHFRDIGQNPEIHNITYENSQARERTQILMDYANKTNGIVIGTGDLSELALGWCTYNGDHMSMYGVNSSIPKTLVRYLVDWFADDYTTKGDKETGSILKDIIDTPVSPELIPPTEGQISQKTEDIVGPYELHDFFLYYVLRFGFSPKKIFFLAKHAFLGKKAEGTGIIYTEAIIFKWLQNFYRRFFNQQFKRSCMPDGAKVGTINLSPRGDWRMPSDACNTIWNLEIEELEKELSC